MIKYIGIRPKGPGTLGNEGDIWYRNSNGVYVCDKKRMVLTKIQIDRDVKNGYLKKLEDENISK